MRYCAGMTQAKRGKVQWSTGTAAVRQRVRALRTSRGWSARELGERLEAAGLAGFDRSIVASFESGRRASVSVDELLVLALVLDVSPVDLLTPVDMALGVGDAVIARDEARAWLGGRRPLPSQDRRRWELERPPAAEADALADDGAAITAEKLARILSDAGVVAVHFRGRDDGEA
jgi:transcriptional regulator with XRE-family HTH domain